MEEDEEGEDEQPSLPPLYPSMTRSTAIMAALIEEEGGKKCMSIATCVQAKYFILNMWSLTATIMKIYVIIRWLHRSKKR